MPSKKDNEVVWHHATVTRERREALNRHRSVVVWFTGLSGAGKSTIAHETEEALHRLGVCRTWAGQTPNAKPPARIREKNANENLISGLLPCFWEGKSGR